MQCSKKLIFDSKTLDKYQENSIDLPNRNRCLIDGNLLYYLAERGVVPLFPRRLFSYPA